MKKYILLLVIILGIFGVKAQTFQLTAPSDASSIQWYVSTSFSGTFSPIAGATAATYGANEPGFYYATYMLGSCENETNVYFLVREGSDVAYPITLNGNTEATQIQWYKDEAALAGETNNALEVTEDGVYRFESREDGCRENSTLFKFFTLVQDLAAEGFYVLDLSTGTTDGKVSGSVISDSLKAVLGTYLITVIVQPNQGNLVMNPDGSFDYTALSSNFFGLDSFVYVICVGQGQGQICDTATVYIESRCEDLIENELYIPNLLSPNNDGKNDRWVIPNLSAYKKCYEYSDVIVFNRWEVKVFHKHNYGLDGIWWDGRLSENTSLGLFTAPIKELFLPPGTYFYIIMLNNDRENALTGFLHIQY